LASHWSVACRTSSEDDGEQHHGIFKQPVH
jgi:hypothetical protein